MLDALYKWSKDSIFDEIIIFALIIAFIEFFAQNLLKGNHGSFTFFSGLAVYALVGYVLHFSYDHFYLSKFNSTWSCLSIIFAMLTGYYLYNENITYKNILAAIFAIIAIIINNI